MSETPGNDLAVLIAQEVAKQLPVREIYEEGLSSATKEAGGFLTDLVKTIRLALAPLQYTAALQDRLRQFLDNSVQRVPLERRILPPPQILGPVIEAIRYEPEGSISDEAFSKLLSSAFDRERAGQAHPAFPGILRAVSTDELVLLKGLAENVLEVPCRRLRGDDTADIERQIFAACAPELTYPEHLLVYCEHLESLGLIRQLIAISTEASAADAQGYALLFWPLRLSDFGSLFVRAALT